MFYFGFHKQNIFLGPFKFIGQKQLFSKWQSFLMLGKYEKMIKNQTRFQVGFQTRFQVEYFKVLHNVIPRLKFVQWF